MEKKTRRLFSLLLAAVLCLALAAPAFAAEAEPPEKELHFVWLDQNENGQFFAGDEALRTDNPGQNGLGYNSGHQDALLFFIWNNRTNKREGYVVPTAGNGLVVEKIQQVDRNVIASGARQASNYVFLRMTEYADSTLTARDLTMNVSAQLDDFGFYSAETPSNDTILMGGVDAAGLTGNTLYFCAPYMGTEEAATRPSVSNVEKNHGEDDLSGQLYDVEQVRDGLWKISLNEKGVIALTRGGVWVSLKFWVDPPEGERVEDGRGIVVFHNEQQGPMLWVAYPDWDEEGRVTCNLETLNSGVITAWKGASNDGLVVGACDTDENGQPIASSFRPIEPAELTASEGLSLNTNVNCKNGDRYARYYFNAVVDAMDQDYTISYGEYAITVSSKPMDLDIYRTPQATAANKAGLWGAAFNPVTRDEPYYIVSTRTDADSGEHLSNARLSADWEDNQLVDLEKVSDSVYRLTIKADANLEREAFLVRLDMTYTDFLGNADTRTEEIEFKAWDGSFVAASDTALAGEGPWWTYADAADTLDAEITLSVGESKDVYLYAGRFTNFVDLTPSQAWRLMARGAGSFRSSGDGLTVTAEQGAEAKVTLTASAPGTYELRLASADYENLKLYHANGNEYTDAEYERFHYEVGYSAEYVGGAWQLQIWTEDGMTTFEEAFPGERYELGEIDSGYLPVTVTVEGGPLPFTDVPQDAWYYNDLAYCVRNGLLTGTSATTFDPNGTAQRAAVVTTLYRREGAPAVTGNSFTDVADGLWYTDAVSWAVANGVGGGYEDNTFRPVQSVTRQELAALLYRYASLKGYDVTARADLSGYADGAGVVEWAAPYVQWAVANGLFHVEGNTLNAGAMARRSDLAFALSQFGQKFGI